MKTNMDSTNCILVQDQDQEDQITQGSISTLLPTEGKSLLYKLMDLWIKLQR